MYSIYSASNVCCLRASFISCSFMSCGFMSCYFMPCKLVRQFHVRHFHVQHFQRTLWLIQAVRGLPAGRFQSWCGVSPLSRPGVQGKLQSHMCTAGVHLGIIEVSIFQSKLREQNAPPTSVTRVDGSNTSDQHIVWTDAAIICQSRAVSNSLYCGTCGELSAEC